MKKIGNGFKEYYYLTEQADVYNANTDKILKADYENRYKLKTIEGKGKSITKKTLYKLVYNKILCEDNIKDLDNEVWKVIPQTDNKYYVSNKGRVKSYCGNKARILKSDNVSRKYKRVAIKVNNKVQHILTHKLVALCFLGEQPVDTEIHHKDGNKKNNNADNLMYVTREEHIKLHAKMKEQELNNIEESQ